MVSASTSLGDSVVGRWDRFWYAEGDPLSLGVFRVLFALGLALELPITRSTSMFAVQGGFHLPYLPFPVPVPPALYFAIHSLQYPFIVLLALGVVPRIAAAALLVLQGYIFFTDQLNFRNHPYFFLLILLCLVFAPSGQAFSLPALIRRSFQRPGRPAAPTRVPLTMQRLIQVQVSIVYFYAALHKLSTPFLSGQVLATIMHDSMVGGRLGPLVAGWLSPAAAERFQAAASHPEFWVPVAWMTVIIELSLVFLLWIPRWRVVGMVLGIGFHVGIGYLMKIDVFSAMMISSYVLFLDPETLPRLLRARADRAQRAAPPAASPAVNRPPGQAGRRRARRDRR